MTGKFFGGKKFYYGKAPADEAYPDTKFYAKAGKTLFAGFESHADFHVWRENVIQVARHKKLPIQIFEGVYQNHVNAFFADIECYSTRLLTPDEVADTQAFIISTVNATATGFEPRINNDGKWTYDHRELNDPEKPDYRFKFSMHVVYNGILFDGITHDGPMIRLAKKINTAILPELRSKGGDVFNSMHIPGDNLFDLNVYKKDSYMRAIGGSKKNSKWDEYLRPVGEVGDIADWFITKDMEVCDIPSEKLYTDTYTGKASAKRSASPRPNAPARVVDKEQQTVTEKALLDWLEEKWGDTVSVVSMEKPDRDGNPQYAIKASSGNRRPCKQCDKTHGGNRAIITDLGGGDFKYFCHSGHKILPNITFSIPVPDDDTEPAFEFPLTDDTPEPEVQTEAGGRYVPSLRGVKERLILIKAQMGAGKTTAVIDLIRSLPEDSKILWVTCRMAMAISLKGRLPDFSLYMHEMDADRQIVEYESMHKMTKVYDYIILDEIRSTLKSMTCRATNRSNTASHADILVKLCRNSTKTIMMDADLTIDPAVESFCKRAFPNEKYKFIDHKGGSLGLHIVCVNKIEIMKRIFESTERGETIAICCGSVRKLQAIEKALGELIGPDKVAGYYAGGPKQAEIIDVNKYWKNYKVVLYTSTITCSVSYEGTVDRVFLIPSTRTFSPREASQMIARCRDIISKQVIVQFVKYETPLNVDHVDEFAAQMKKMDKKRQGMKGRQTALDKAYLASYTREIKLNEYIFEPTILTEQFVWEAIEEERKVTKWYQEFLRVLEHKGYTWQLDTLAVLPPKAKLTGHAARINDLEKEIDAALLDEITELDALSVTSAGAAQLVRLIQTLKATPEDHLMHRKYQCQVYFTDNLTGQDVVDFERNKRAIVNRLMAMNVPTVYRKKIYMNEGEMSDIVDFYLDDIYVLDYIDDCLKILGVERGVLDTDTIFDMTEDNDEVDNILCKMDVIVADQLKITPGVEWRKSRATTTMGRLCWYIQVYAGMEAFRTERTWNIRIEKVDGPFPDKKIRYMTSYYKLQPLYHEFDTKRCIFGNPMWVKEKFDLFDAKRKIEGYEMRRMKSTAIIIRTCKKFLSRIRAYNKEQIRIEEAEKDENKVALIPKFEAIVTTQKLHVNPFEHFKYKPNNGTIHIHGFNAGGGRMLSDKEQQSVERFTFVRGELAYVKKQPANKGVRGHITEHVMDVRVAVPVPNATSTRTQIAAYKKSGIPFKYKASKKRKRCDGGIELNPNMYNFSLPRSKRPRYIDTRGMRDNTDLFGIEAKRNKATSDGINGRVEAIRTQLEQSEVEFIEKDGLCVFFGLVDIV